MERICPHCGYEGKNERCPNDDFPTVDPTHFALTEGAPQLSGTVLADRYVIGEHIGDGATGWVFKAEHLSTKQVVAVKILRRDLTRKMIAIRRFYMEARSCASLSHPNIIRVFDFGATVDGFLYMAMEYLEGESLRERVKRQGACSIQMVLRIGCQLASALEVAHSSGIIHRDLKPANIHLCQVGNEGDVAKILDFGLAKAIADEELQVGITAAGFLVGSPGFIAPEQVMGHPADGRADLYALGVTLYQLLTARLPFSASKVERLLKKQLTTKPRPLPTEVNGVAIPPHLIAVVMRLLAFNPEDRFQSAREVRQALRDVEAGKTPGFIISDVVDVETHDEEGLSALRQSPSRRVAGWPLIAAGVAAAITAALLIWDDPVDRATQPSTAEPAISNNTSPSPPAPPPDVAGAEITTASLNERPGPTGASTDVAPTVRLVLLNSTPQGAEIRAGDELLGKTPMNIPLREGTSRSLDVVYSGAETKKIVLGDDTDDSVTVVFDDVRAEARPTPARRKPRRRANDKKALKIKIL